VAPLYEACVQGILFIRNVLQIFVALPLSMGRKTLTLCDIWHCIILFIATAVVNYHAHTLLGLLLSSGRCGGRTRVLSMLSFWPQMLFLFVLFFQKPLLFELVLFDSLHDLFKSWSHLLTVLKRIHQKAPQYWFRNLLAYKLLDGSVSVELAIQDIVLCLMRLLPFEWILFGDQVENAAT
jgi:hypothetical protein